jgi:catechol 2,3-dioxygenase-like lactoylglutathione lyase family enzyme
VTAANTHPHSQLAPEAPEEAATLRGAADAIVPGYADFISLRGDEAAAFACTLIRNALTTIRPPGPLKGVTLPDLQGIDHVELTVRDAERSAAWYQRVLGFHVRGVHYPENAHLIVMGHQSGMILGVWQRGQQPATDLFSEFRTGLDHMAFRVSTRDEIDDWIGHFASLGVEHSEPVDTGQYGVVLTFRDPDNIQLEIYWRPE